MLKMKCCREKAVAMEGMCKTEHTRKEAAMEDTCRKGIYNKVMYGSTGT